MRQIKGRVVIDCWDNGGETVDRYSITVSGLQSIPVMKGPDEGKMVSYTYHMRASACPFHPQGFGQHGHEEPTRGYSRTRYSHLGKPIDFLDLPADVRRFVASELMPEPGEGE